MWKSVLDTYDLLDSPGVDGEKAAVVLRSAGGTKVEIERLWGPSNRSTDVVKVVLPGRSGRGRGGSAPTLGIVGMLGGVGARPERTGFVSDGDGALAALACALKAVRSAAKGDHLEGDLIVSTHICPSSPTRLHDPVPFMSSPVELNSLLEHLVDERMEAILSIDATKGNRVINWRGFAISPPVREGWILRVSPDLLALMEAVSGHPARVLPITMQDITPYGNGIFHINSIMQPAVITPAPVVGVAVTAETAVAGSATGASRLHEVEEAARFCLEVAKAFGRGDCRLVDDEEYRRLVDLYGSMSHLSQRKGGEGRS